MDSTALSRLLPRLATLLAAGVLGYVVVQNMDLLLPAPSDTQEETAGPAATTRMPPPNPAEELAQLSSWHLFGEELKTSAAPAAVQQINAPKTRLQLSLHGVFTPPNRESEGWAIISAPGEPEKGYRIGDELPGGAQLYAVELNQVILTRSGQHESLPLPNINLPDNSMDSHQAPPLPGPTDPQTSTEPQEQTMAAPPETEQTIPSPASPPQPDPATLEQLRSDPRYQGLIAPEVQSE